MAHISKYVLVDRDDNEGEHEYDSYDEAVKLAEDRNCAVIERQYVYDDSSLVWTPDGSTTWPPSKVKVKDAYEGGVCPDCGEPISENATPGDECLNCGHVFWPDTPSDDEE